MDWSLMTPSGPFGLVEVEGGRIAPLGSASWRTYLLFGNQQVIFQCKAAVVLGFACAMFAPIGVLSSRMIRRRIIGAFRGRGSRA